MKSILLLSIILISNLFSEENKLNQQMQELKIYNAAAENNFMPQNEGNYLEYSNKMHQYLNDIQSQYPDYKIPGAKQFLRKDYFVKSRLGSDGSSPDYLSAFKQYLEMHQEAKKSPEFLALNEWEFVGPSIRPIQRNGLESDRGTGRANVLRIDPKNSNVLWVGSASGGVWKSTDKGQSWNNFELTGFASLGISDIAIAPSNTNVVYAATGDKNTRGGGTYNTFTIGLLKTTNGGNTWELTRFLEGTQQSNRRLIYKVLVHPTNHDKLYVSSSEGLFTSENGGNTWDVIDNAREYGDIEFHPTNPNIIYTIRIDTYASKTLRTYSVSENNFISNQTYTSASRGELEVSTANPDDVYCLFAHTGNYFRSLEKSTNRGGTWSTLRSINDGVNYLGFSNGTGQDLQLGQGWYDLTLAVDPSNDDDIYIGGVNIWKSSNGGNSFQIASFMQMIQQLPFVHADQHYFEFDKEGTLYSCNDGGVKYTTNNGTTWVDISDGLEITQFYRFSQSMQDPNFYVAGAQDNSTFIYDKSTWYEAISGDGFHTAVDPNDDMYVYASSNVGGSGGLIWRSSNRGISFTQGIGPAQFGSGENAQWVTPFEVDPHNPNKIYAGYQNIFVSEQRGIAGSWQRLTNFNAGNNTVKYIAHSPINKDILYCAIGNNLIQVNKINGSFVILYQAPVQISWIQPDLTDPNTIYITMNNFSTQNKVIKVTNSQPTNITYNLPNLAANTIVQQPITGDLYVGMDAGVYKLTKNANSWQVFDKGLTTTVISELEIQKSTGKLRAATYGRGIWEVELLDCQLAQPNVNVDGNLDLCEGETVVLTYTGGNNNFEWSNGAKTKSISVSQPGRYYVTIYDSKGCFAQSEYFDVSITENIEITINIPNEQASYCEGDEVRLTLPLTVGTGTYLWSNGETSRNIVVTESGDYWVEYTKIGTNCTFKSETVSLSFKNLPSKPEIEKNGNELVAVGASGIIQWYLNGESLTDANEEIYTPTVDGIYTVSATNVSNCTNTSDEYEVNWLSVDNTIFQGISLNPNPNNGQFELRVNSEFIGLAELSIIDLQGQKIYTENVTFSGKEFYKTLKIDNIAKGIYFLKIQSGNSQINTKFIVE